MKFPGKIQSYAYAQIRSGILNLTMKPGTPINPLELADQMGVSKTPVREALIYLCGEGLVQILPQRGTMVTRMDINRVNQERFMRERMEEVIMGAYLHTPLDKENSKLGKLLFQQQAALKMNDFVAFRDLDDAFHAVFYETAEHSLSWEIMKQSNTHYSRVRLLGLNRDNAAQIIREHQQLLEYIRDGDKVQALLLLHTHLHRLDAEISSLSENYPDYFDSKSSRNNAFRLI